MTKKLINFAVLLVMVISIFTGVALTAEATDGLDYIKVDKVWNGTWDANTEEKYAYLTVDKTGYYDISVEDLNNTGSLMLMVKDLELSEDDYSWYNTNVYLSTEDGANSLSKVYFIEGHLYEFTMRYGYYDYNWNHVNLEANINVTVSSTDYQPLSMTLGQYKNLTVGYNTVEWLEFKTTTAGDYIFQTNQTTSVYMAVYEKSSGEFVDDIGYYDTTKARMNLKANTEYIVLLEGWEESAKLLRLSVSKATNNVTKVEIVQNDVLILADEGYVGDDYAYLHFDDMEALDYKITYSDKKTEILSHSGCMSAGIQVNMIYYKGEIYEYGYESFLTPGKQSVEVDYMNGRKSVSSIYVSTYLEWCSNLNVKTDYDDMRISYEDDYYHAYYWRIKPDETNNYEFYSYDWDQIDSDVTIFDENNKVVPYTDGYNLKGGQEYCLKIGYYYEEDCYDDVVFHMEPHRDHVHDSKGKEVVKATLSKNGATNITCSMCGYINSSTTIYSPKTFKLSATSYTCDGKVKTPTVTVKDSNGNTLKKDTDYTVKYESGRKEVGKYTVTITFKGNYSGTKKLYFSINGLKKVNGVWSYVKDGAVAKTYTGLVKHTDGKYYYVKSGVKTSFNGLVKYNGKWYYVKSGVVNTSYTGLVKHTDGKFHYVKNGVKTSFNGLVKYNSKWYYVKDGVVNTSYTGLVKHTDGKWYYVKKGVKTSYTGTVTYNGKKYKVKNGVKV